MADDHGRTPEPGDEPLEPLQPVEVEVVGGLVEQQHVVAGEQQRGEPGPGGLTARQRGHRHGQVDGEPDLGGHLARAVLQVGAAEGEPAVQRGGVGVVGAGGAVAERRRGRVHRLLGRGDAGAPRQERRHRLAGSPVGLLRQVSDGGVGRADGDLPVLRGRPRPRASAAAWTCRRRSRRRARRRHRGRPRGRARRTGRVRRGRRRVRWPAGWRSCRIRRYRVTPRAAAAVVAPISRLHLVPDVRGFPT